MPSRSPFQMRTLLSRSLQTLALSAVAIALVSPPAEAARRHVVVAEKQTVATPKRRIARTFIVARHRGPIHVAAFIPARPSFGQLAGLHTTTDELDLKSSVALVIDQDTREVLLRKNDSAVLPIASITKLMTGLIVSEAKLPTDEMIEITQDDVDTEKGTSSRLRVGTTLSRGELLHLALMSSENRAAHALGRTYPGGMPTFVALMNAKAKAIGM